MRRLLLSTLALASTAFSALAADLPSTKAAPALVAPVPVFAWTGFYVGVYGGGVFSSTNVTDPLAGAHYNQSPSGGTVGGLVGYNYQFNPNWVIGIEGEGGWQGYSTSTNFVSLSNGDTFHQTVDTDYAARIRGRLGYAFGDRALLFVAGGVSFSDIKVRLADTTNASGPYSITQDYTGWNIGGGVDYAFTPNWVGRIEYIYDNYGAQNYAFSNLTQVGANTFNSRRVSEDESTVRAALIYKFGVVAPIVAKY
jgi:outer membrane immunogenic protein